MAGGIGGFVAGLENLSFIEDLSDRFEMAPHTLLRILSVVVVSILVVAIWLFTQGSIKQEEVLESVPSADTLERLSTEFDEVTPAATPTTPETTTTQELVVYVTGAVAHPGIYSFTTSQRIGDAVDAAGGFLPEAAVAVVNLALPLTDGMQIHIPRSNEVAVDAPDTTLSTSAGSTQQGTGVAALVNINTADSETLQTLDGVGPATAQKIIDYRTAHGRFEQKEDLMNVSGIGEKKYAALEARITV